jgi:hypothetical protein
MPDTYIRKEPIKTDIKADRKNPPGMLSGIQAGKPREASQSYHI